MSDRLEELERRLAAVEALLAARPGAGAAVADDPQRARGTFWALDGLKERLGDSDGAVMLLGAWNSGGPDGSGVEWQYASPTAHLLDHDWAVAAPGLAALGHPVRLDLLRHVLTGTTATKDLAETEGLGTSGQLHHHLRALVSAGWLRQRQRGDYEVPGPRVIPLMVILLAVLE